MHNITPSFLKSLCSKWDELHDTSSVFQYKINKLEERYVGGKYLLQLNPDRQIKRRAPEVMNDICQPFDKNKFNFNKVSSEEILFPISISNDSDLHTILVNISPISRYHSLLCPAVDKCLPQVVTLESLELAVSILFQAEDRDLRIGFNSMCAFASVNHLHYHLFVEKHDLYVENVSWHHINGSLYCLDNKYPVPAFCFEIEKHSIVQSCAKIYKLLQHFLDKSIGHNILLSNRQRPNGKAGVVNVIVWPRRNTSGAKQMGAFNVAVLELSGWFPIYDSENFKTLQAEDLEKELIKWRVNNFEQLCEDIKYIFN